jgi:hypothetical protein
VTLTMSSALANQAKKAPLWLKIVGVAGVGLVAAPFVIASIKGVVGLIALAVVIFLAMIFVPIIFDAIAISGIKAGKFLAKTNPIEELERQYIAGKEKMREHHAALQTFIGGITGIESDFNKMVARYPNRRAEFEERMRKLKAVQRAKEMAYIKANQDLERFSLVIEEARMVWDMACKMAEVEKLAGRDLDPMDEVKRQTALDTVTDAMNTSLASLDMAMLDNQVSLERDITPVVSSVMPAQVLLTETQPAPRIGAKVPVHSDEVIIDLNKR